MKHHYIQAIFFCLFIFIATLILIKEGVGLTPDRYVLVLLLGAIMLHKGIKFIHDFLPFILLLEAADFVRGYADDLSGVIHYSTPIVLTKLIFFGYIPTIELQKLFYTPGIIRWYDFVATFLYLLHFAVPLAFAFLLWYKNRKYFIEFMVGLSLMSYGALLFYLAYPVAPPWLAALHGYLPPITKIFDIVVLSFPEVLHLPTFYSQIGSNLVAAIPSMHTAYSYFVFISAVRYFGKIGYLFLIYTLAMWLSIVYLGEHYLVDIIIGVIYATIFFKLGQFLIKKYYKYFELI